MAVGGEKTPRVEPTGERPQRTATYTLAAMLWIAIFASYSMRANLSIAMHGQRGMAQQFDWGDSEKGVLLSSFFWGYIVSQLPGGWLANRFGGKRVLLVSMICSMVATVATPKAAAISLNAVVACRVCLGMASGVLYPVLASMLGRWVTDVDRATCYNIADTGGSCGIILCALGGPWLIEHGSVQQGMGWEYCFYYPAAIGVPWVFLWVLLVSDSPANNQWISRRERAWVLTKLQREAHGNTNANAPLTFVSDKKNTDVDWGTLLASPPLWGMYLGIVSSSWTWYTLMTFLPQYLLEIMGYDLTKSGIIFTIPYLCMMISEVTGAFVADKLIKSGRASLFTVRTTVTAVAGFGCAACLVGVAQHESSTTTIALFGASLAFVALNNTGSFLVANDLYPRVAGVAMGIANTLGTIPGIVSPVLSGFLLSKGKCPKDEKYHADTPSSCADAWDVIFYIAAAIFALFALIFFRLASVSYKGVGYHRGEGRHEDASAQPLLGHVGTPPDLDV